jgi:hypothetical protein
MSLYEALIIYLAAGAPFAVLFFLRNRLKSGFQTYIVTFGTWIFWLPGLVIVVFSRRWTTSNTDFFDQFDSLDAEIKERVCEILNLARSDENFAAFRISLEQFTELSTAMMFSGSSMNNLENNLLEIAGHGNEKVGSACLRRKKRAKLAIHKARASEDLIRLFENQIIRNGDSKQIREKLYRLCELLGDNRIADRFRYAKGISEKFEIGLPTHTILAGSATKRETATF